MNDCTLLYPRLSIGSRRESVIAWLVFGLMMRILIGAILSSFSGEVCLGSVVR